MSADEPKYNIIPHWIKRLPEPRQGLAIALVGLYLLIAIVGGLWAVGEFFVALSSDAKDAHVAIRNTGFIFLAAMGAPLVIWRAVVAQGNLDRSRDRDYADLFTKAVEQLGATREVKRWDKELDREVTEHESNIEVRLGAIYALQRTGKDSKKDHSAVIETLAAYVRENYLDQPIGHRFRSDVRAALTALPTLFEARPFEEISPSLGFKYDLRGLKFRRLAMGHILLFGADLSRSDFGKSGLRKSDLRFTNLYGAKFSGCIIDGCRLDYSNLSSASFADVKNLTNDMLVNCFGSAGTILPDYAEKWRPEWWTLIPLDEIDARSTYNDWVADKMKYW